MGSSASKAGRAATATSARKFPTKPSPALRSSPTSAPPNPTIQQPGPSVHPETQASSTKTNAINLDADDPVYAQHLRELGAVQPNPILSHSSQHPSDPRSDPFSSQAPTPGSEPSQPSLFPAPGMNPALMILQARQRLQTAAERETDMAGSRGFEGKSFIDIQLLQQVLVERARGASSEAIEKKFDLKRGTVQQMGPRDVVDIV